MERQQKCILKDFSKPSAVFFVFLPTFEGQSLLTGQVSLKVIIHFLPKIVVYFDIFYWFCSKLWTFFTDFAPNYEGMSAEVLLYAEHELDSTLQEMVDLSILSNFSNFAKGSEKNAYWCFLTSWLLLNSAWSFSSRLRIRNIVFSKRDGSWVLAHIACFPSHLQQVLCTFPISFLSGVSPAISLVKRTVAGGNNYRAKVSMSSNSM